MSKAIVFWGLCAVLIFVPLPLGSVDQWAIFIFEAAVLALFLVYLGGEFLARKKTRGAWGETGEGGGTRFSGPPESGFRARGEEGNGAAFGAAGLPPAVKILLAVFLVISVLQILPLPPGVVKVLSPRAAAIYQGMAQDGLAGWDTRSWWTLSLSPLLSAGELVLLVSYGLFGFLVLRTVRTRRRIEIFVLVIIASALFQAFYGMAQTFSGTEKIFGYQKKYNIGSVTGTYVNRNHFAGFMEMAFPLSLGYLLAKAKYFLMEKGLSWRKRILWFGQENLQWSLLFGLGTVFIGIALVFSKSRSGVMIFLVTVILAAAAFGSWRELSDRAHERRRQRGILRLVAAVVLAAVLWLGVGPIIERFGEMDISKEARRTFMSNTFKMAREFPWAGTGKGNFVYAYAMVKKVDTGFMLSYAHNDYLEIAAENGFIAGGCLVVAAFWLVVWLAGQWRKRRNNFAKGIGLGAILGILALLLHGFTDFNLQIPANAVYFVGLCALALNLVLKGETGKTATIGGETVSNGEVRAGRGPKPWVRTVAAVAVAIGLIVFATGEFLGFHYLGLYQDARAEARSVQSDFPELEGLMREATGYSGNPELRKEMARLYVEMARAQNESGQPEKRDASCDLAVANYAAVLGRNPIDSFAQYEMGMTYLLYNYPMMTYADKAKMYFRKAIELNPADEFLNLNILYFYLTSWDGLSGEDRDYAGGRLRRIRSADPAFMPQLEERWTQQFGSTEKLNEILVLLAR
jgi:hypothetical protein